MNKAIKQFLEEGGVITHPTDTVCGISCSYLSKKGFDSIYRLKKRPLDKPLAVLIANIETISLFADISKKALKPLIPFLNNGMTLIIPRKNSLPKHLLDQSPNIALRIPNHKKTLSIIKECGPLICTSANISGEPPISSKEESEKQFGKNTLFIEGEMPISKTPSSILSFLDGKYQLLREGNISKEEIEKQVPLSF